MKSEVPEWAADAIWYQIFVSRFRNGEPANDPPGIRPWSHDWTAPDADGKRPSMVDLFSVRYGGDLQGVIEKLPYLQDLGVNALYLNPIFEAQTEHKYDASDLRHVDPTFGCSSAECPGAPGRSAELRETAEPSTWRWTEADRTFLALLRQAHAVGIRVVIDGVFNHVGQGFWAWKDVLSKGKDSAYADWFEVLDWGPPLRWAAWDGENGRLVRFKQTADGFAKPVEDHLYAITRRWMDPDGDGDPADGIDGWRLDAAEKVPHEFWKRWRKLVKSINPQAIILGEIWPPAGEWLEGDEFDVVTNYQFAVPVTRWVREREFKIQNSEFKKDAAAGTSSDPTHPPTSPASRRAESPDVVGVYPGAPAAAISFATGDFLAELEKLRNNHPWPVTLAMVNLLASHDTDRVVSMMANPGRDYDKESRPGEGNPFYHNGRPDDAAIRRAKLAAVLQFTMPGAPMIYYGDELGMYGGDDPYCRAPMWWPDLADAAGPLPNYAEEFRGFVKHMIRLRREHPALRRGDFRLILADDGRRILAFERRLERRSLIVVINAGGTPDEVSLALERNGTNLALQHLVGDPRPPGLQGDAGIGADGRWTATLPACSAVAFWDLAQH